MNKILIVAFFVLSMTVRLEGKRFSWGRGSTSRRTSYKSAPTLFSHVQPSAPKLFHSVEQKPSLFAWQEKPRQDMAAYRQSKQPQIHSYPSSGTRLSGNNKAPSPRQESAQKSHMYPQNTQKSPKRSDAKQKHHAYPASPGFSGNSGSGSRHPQQIGGGLSGNSKQAPPPYPRQTNPGIYGAALSPYPGPNTNYNGRAQTPAPWYSKNGYSGVGNQQSNRPQTYSYPSSGTGLSGINKAPSPRQESAQKSHRYPQNTQISPKQSNTNQQNHAYPAFPGSSGSSGSGSSYPQQTGGGLSGNSKQAPPPYPGHTNAGLSGAALPPYPGPNTNYNGRAKPPAPWYSNNGYSGVGGGAGYPPNNYGSSYHHPQGPPPAYSNYGGYGSHHQGVGPQMPGYFGNYGGDGYGQGFRGVSRTSSALRGVGIAGAGIGTVLAGLALWNLARSTGRHHHTVIYDNRGQPVAVAPSNDNAAFVDPMLADLVNCSLTIDRGNMTEVLAIPCAIASSFSPGAKVEDPGVNNDATDNSKCIVSVLTKSGKEYMTTIPCSVLLNTAAENNVTEPPVVINDGGTVNDIVAAPSASRIIDEKPLEIITLPSALALSPDATTLNCSSESGKLRDPLNPCFAIKTDLSQIPLQEAAPAA